MLVVQRRSSTDGAANGIIPVIRLPAVYVRPVPALSETWRLPPRHVWSGLLIALFFRGWADTSCMPHGGHVCCRLKMQKKILVKTEPGTAPQKDKGGQHEARSALDEA